MSNYYHVYTSKAVQSNVPIDYAKYSNHDNNNNTTYRDFINSHVY